MSETITAAIIGAIISMVTTALTLSVNAKIALIKAQSELQLKREGDKRETLTDIYVELGKIINLFPKESPNDVVLNVEFPPHYSMESFDSMINSLNYQIQDYRRALENIHIDLDSKNYNEAQIRNREYAISKIETIKEEYCEARDKYGTFCKSKKGVLELYAGADVKNAIVEFEVLVHNVFISGYPVNKANDSRYNEIEVSRRNIISCMQKDIGLNQ